MLADSLEAAPPREATIGDFYIDIYEVSNADYGEFDPKKLEDYNAKA